MGKKRVAIKKIEEADVEISQSISGWKDTTPVEVLGWLGKMTDQPPLYTLIGGVAAAALIRRDDKLLRTSARMLIAHWLGIRAKNAVKSAVDRTRPRMLIEEGLYEAGRGQREDKAFSSFPSGHTVGALALARAIMRDYPEHAAAGYAMSVAAAVARIAKCDHFASDTAAGAVIGYVAEQAASAVLDRILPSHA